MFNKKLDLENRLTFCLLICLSFFPCPYTFLGEVQNERLPDFADNWDKHIQAVSSMPGRQMLSKLLDQKRRLDPLNRTIRYQHLSCRNIRSIGIFQFWQIWRKENLLGKWHDFDLQLTDVRFICMQSLLFCTRSTFA